MKRNIKEQTNLLLLKYADPSLSEKEKRKIENEIIELNVPLLNNLVKKYIQDKTRGFFEDFLQEARFGTLKAIRTYDPSKDISFTSYAGVCAENNIKMFMRSFLKTSYIGFAQRDFKRENGRDATMQEICEYKGISEGQYKNYSQGPVSFESLTYSKDDDKSIGDNIAVDPIDLEEKVISDITAAEIIEKIEQLPFRYRYVVKRIAVDEVSQETVAEEMQVSRSLISKDFTKGRAILKQMLEGGLDERKMKVYGMGTVEDREMTLTTYLQKRTEKREARYNQGQIEEMKKYLDDDRTQDEENKKITDNFIEMPNIEEKPSIKTK